jgi:hypothetical protein
VERLPLQIVVFPLWRSTHMTLFPGVPGKKAAQPPKSPTGFNSQSTTATELMGVLIVRDGRIEFPAVTGALDDK